jgi:hypothetical protein
MFISEPNERRKFMSTKLATIHPSLARNQVWCRQCGATQKVDSGECLSKGWPKHCGFTMTIDSPEEQKEYDKYLARS